MISCYSITKLAAGRYSHRINYGGTWRGTLYEGIALLENGRLVTDATPGRAKSILRAMRMFNPAMIRWENPDADAL